MPIVVTCPNCPAKLSAPESAAGKKIRCPKCGAVAAVPAMIPAEEVPVVDAALTSPRPQPKPRLVQAEVDEDEPPRKKRRDDDDDDNRPKKRASRDDDDEAPRKKKKKRYADDDDDYDHDHPRRKKRPNKGAGGAMVAVLIGGGLVMLIGIGLVIWLVAGKGGSSSSSAKKAPPPPGWEQYSYPDAGIKAYLPARPDQMTVPVNALGMGGFGRPGRGGFRGADLQELESFSIFNSRATDGAHVEIIVMKFRNRVPASIRDELDNQPAMQVGRGETQTVQWLGHDATELVGANGTSRIVYTERHAVVAMLTGPRGTRPAPETAAGFFDSFELTK